MSETSKATAAQIGAALAQGVARRSFLPPLPPPPATRQGQKELVAATLAAGLIAGSGGTATPADAVSLWREVMGVAWPA